MATTDCIQKPSVLPPDPGPLSDENNGAKLSKSLSNLSDLAGQAAGNERSPPMSTDSPKPGQTTDLAAYPMDLGSEIIPNGEVFARQVATQIVQVQHEYDLRASAGLSTPRMAGDFMNLVFPASPRTGTIAPPQSPQVNGTLPRYYHQLQGVPYEEIYTIKDRQRVSQACDLCRRRKAKCSGGRPCKRCTERDLSCEYADAQSRRRGKTRKRADDKDPSETSLEDPASSALPVQDPSESAFTEATSQGSVVRTKPRKKKPAPILPYTYKPIYPHILSPVASGLHVVDSSTQDRRQDYADYWPFAQYPRTASDTALDYSGPSTGISLPLPSQASFDDLAPSNMLALFDHALSAVTSDKNCNYASTQPNGYHNSSGEPEDSVLASSSAPIDPQIPCSNTQDIFYTIVAPLPSLPFPALGLSIDSPSVFCPSHDLAHSATTTESSSSTGSPFSVLGMLPPDVAEVSLAEGVNIGDRYLVQGIDSATEESFIKLLSNSPLFP
ncbi:hypothetical protein BDN71DRAFT_1513090 [Pleurotus eryngii]|uniref:Zn(2)-C6 fungal-type domain-containing protein n=1 Tax=Pleurotus eryngii TaxID=5323 RepID=A0A9P5ZHY3_PLEER|nr:hypothetical protein BDN71DRAFT_1513090 [Pleurotus eryngii]